MLLLLPAGPVGRLCLAPSPLLPLELPSSQGSSESPSRRRQLQGFLNLSRWLSDLVVSFCTDGPPIPEPQWYLEGPFLPRGRAPGWTGAFLSSQASGRIPSVPRGQASSLFLTCATAVANLQVRFITHLRHAFSVSRRNGTRHVNSCLTPPPVTHSPAGRPREAEGWWRVAVSRATVLSTLWWHLGGWSGLSPDAFTC